MRVNKLFELHQLLFAGRALQRHGSPHSGETRTHPFIDGKKSAEVENALKLDLDAIERNAKRRRVSAVRDLLACRQSRQDQLHRIWTGIRAAESRRLVDRQRELANPGLAPKILNLSRVDRKDRFCIAGVRAQTGLRLRNDLFQRHPGLPKLE
jgi:hypothetical protein